MQEEKMLVNGYFLDEEQLKPVLDDAKYQLIIAGAGSGKSLTLIGKIKYVLDHHIYKPEEICCISFTNEAVDHLRKNILKNCNVEVPTFTFHKLALTILQQEKIEYHIAEERMLQKTIDEFFKTKCFGNIFLQKIIYQKFSFTLFRNEKTWSKILSSSELLSFQKMIQTFIALMKSNGLGKKELLNFMKQKKHTNTLLLIYAIYTLYETEKEADASLDFDDMMNYATSILKNHGCHLPFRFLIIDEFQDTSFCRFHLIQEIVRQNNASLCVVGDDYQSIYHFSGCDLYLFLHFQEYYPDAKIYKLEKTYRNSQELISVAGKFIQKNKEQVKKELKSDKTLKNPVFLVYTKKTNQILKKIISKIPPEKEILILGRNHFDLKRYTKNFPYIEKENHFLEFKGMEKRKIRFLTIHSSKGLECDEVILLNVENSLYGIPNQMKEEAVLSFVKKRFFYPFEEERRLFYVALTRTKNHIYLIVPKENPSIFVREIKHEKNVKIIHV